jgi:hypothetical protein
MCRRCIFLGYTAHLGGGDGGAGGGGLGGGGLGGTGGLGGGGLGGDGLGGGGLGEGGKGGLGGGEQGYEPSKVHTARKLALLQATGAQPFSMSQQLVW